MFEALWLQVLVCPTRGGMELQVRRLEAGRWAEAELLTRHDMIVTSLLVTGDTLLSAGWDARLVFWVGRIKTELSTTGL